jgi:hypothetical protein
MAQVNPGSLTDWQNGQTITAEAYKQEREIIYTAINAFVSTTNGSSGADQVGATQILAGSGTTVQTILEWLYTQVTNVTLGQIPDGSLTDVKLSNAAGQIKSNLVIKSIGSQIYSYRNFGGAL